jgi:zinc protease
MASYGSEDLRRGLEPELRSGYLEISAVGDVDPDELESAVAATFGALRRREGKPAELPVAMALPRGECGDFTYDSEIAKGLVLVYWPTDDRRNIPQKRHLDMLSDILEDRLRLRVRKEMGDAYSPHESHAASATFEHYGYIRACALVDVDRVNEVAYMIHDIGKELQKTGPSGDEFLRVHKPALTEIRELLRKNSYWLCAIDGCQAYPDTLQYIRTMQSFYENAKVEDLRDVLDFLDSGSAITIKVRPEKHEPKSTTE